MANVRTVDYFTHLVLRRMFGTNPLMLRSGECEAAVTESEIDRAHRLACDLPEVEVATWYGTPALKVAGKGFLRVKEPEVLVVMCPLGLKEALMAAEPGIFYETPHYVGWPAILVRMLMIDDHQLRDRIECAWAQKAPKRLLKGLEAARIQPGSWD